MSLQLDSLVFDLMFQGSAAIDQKTLIDGLGGQEALESKQLLDVDRLDPRAEMELSPSMPFRRRGERRLMIIDDKTITPREDPQADPLITADLRPAKEQLIATAQALPIRLGRLFSLGTWGDAVLVARSMRDLRGICLLPYALDPQVDIDGKRRGTPLSQKEFEAKILAYEKRLEELDDEQILAGLSGVTFERRGDLVVVDVLEADGTWDQRKSIMMEMQLAAMDRFSILPGAPSATRVAAPDRPTMKMDTDAAVAASRSSQPSVAPAAAKAAPPAAAAKMPEPPKPEPKPEPKGPPLSAREIEGAIVLVFPTERFDLDVAAALGKRDWDQVVRRTDNLTGAMRDKLQRDGATWIAPIEFLSEVFLEGKPLTKQDFERDSQKTDGVKSLDVHLPRFGDVTLLEIAGKGRFVTTVSDPSAAAKLLG
ncbi:MAG: hypothetical protein JWP01_811 [Myxococcales bacterium]|nr:hypothetical protein [Myxococcales bacterium]